MTALCPVARIWQLLLLQAVLDALCGASEYDELPVRHNEDVLNMGLSAQVRLRSVPGCMANMTPVCTTHTISPLVCHAGRNNVCWVDFAHSPQRATESPSCTCVLSLPVPAVPLHLPTCTHVIASACWDFSYPSLDRSWWAHLQRPIAKRSAEELHAGGGAAVPGEPALPGT